MATNPPSGDGHRRGAVRNREQFKLPNGNYMKRDSGTGRFMDQKADDEVDDLRVERSEGREHQGR